MSLFPLLRVMSQGSVHQAAGRYLDCGSSHVKGLRLREIVRRIIDGSVDGSFAPTAVEDLCPYVKKAPRGGALRVHMTGARMPIFSSRGMSSWPRKGSSVT